MLPTQLVYSSTPGKPITNFCRNNLSSSMNSFLHKNQKMAPKWSGHHKILQIKGDINVEIQLKHNNRKTVIHANRLKPYFVASKNLAVCPDFLCFALHCLCNHFLMMSTPPPDRRLLANPMHPAAPLWGG
jgi:hypothetical protein